MTKMNGAGQVRREVRRRHKEEKRGGRDAASSRLFVGGLPWELEDEELIRIFAPYGQPSVEIVRNTKTGRSRGFAYVDFASPEIATVARSALDGMVVGDRAIRVTVVEEQVPKGGFRDQARYERYLASHPTTEDLCPNCQQMVPLFAEWTSMHSGYVNLDEEFQLDTFIGFHPNLERRGEGFGCTSEGEFFLFRCQKCLVYWNIYLWSYGGQIEIEQCSESWFQNLQEQARREKARSRKQAKIRARQEQRVPGDKSGP